MLLAAPKSDDFLNHPDFRTISAFFFGWVFYLSSSMLLTSMWSRLAVRTALKAPATSRLSIDKISEDAMNMISPPSSGDGLSSTLILTLLFSFVTGSLANFGSLLAFRNDPGLCAFAVAWGGLAVESARLMGVSVLLLILRNLGMKRWELIVSVTWVFFGLAFVFINTALATGKTELIEPLETSLCFRTHFLPASVLSSSMYLVLELYIALRLWFRLPWVQDKWTNLLDIRMLRALSLVLLDLLTAVPSATNTNTLAESVPYSIGAIAVLLAFNREADDWALSNGQYSPDAFPPSFSPSALTRREIRRSIPTFSAWVQPHPFSAHSLGDPSILPTWDDERRQAKRVTMQSTKTVDSSTARSVRDTVVHQARREFLMPMEDGPPRSATDTVDTEPSGGQTRSRRSQRKGRRFSRPVLPRLVIVARTDSEQASEGKDAATAGSPEPPTGNLTANHFSPPNVAECSTVAYPERVLSFSSNHHDSVVEAVYAADNSDESPSQMRERLAMDMGTRIVTNPDLLGPSLASPLGPRIPSPGRKL